MSSLKVPDSGLQLLGGQDPDIPPQAFALTLDDSVIESLIRSVKSGGDIKLQLGATPTLQYSGKSHRIAPPEDNSPFDIYLTKPFESTRDATRLPNTSTLFQKLSPAKKSKPTSAAQSSAANTRISSKSSTSSGIDSDLEALKDGLAAHDKARERAHVVNKLPSTSRGAAKAKGKLLSGYNSAPRSLPTSPALNGISSPSSTPALSASQQLMERNKGQRSLLVHELASRDQTESYLEAKWDGLAEDFKHHLEKVGEYQQDSEKWTLKTMYWKELNVWNYDYDAQEDRQMAIDNAIKKYDKGRVDPSDPLWEKLLPKDERGKGKCLSRLQAKLDKGPPPSTAPTAPRIKVQKADDSSTSKDDGDVSDARSGGESMVRSRSNPMPAKAKKPSAQEAQAKRLLNPKARSAVQKPSPTRPKDTGSKANGKRVLSQAIIDNSDSSGDEAVVVKTKPPTRPAPKQQPAKAPAAKPRPAAKEPSKPQPAKRPPREEKEEDSSSSSEAPLAQRLPIKQARQIKPVKQRPAENSSQNARNGPSTSSQPQRHKNTSPIKSSPLASSPPTNASDFEQDARPKLNKKRKAEDDAQTRSAKRPAAQAVPTEVMVKAQRFKRYYEKYETLHHEISSLSNPPNDKVQDLLDMRNRLESMKQEIYRRYAAVPA